MNEQPKDILSSFFAGSGGSGRKKRVVLVAPVFTMSGYGNHARQVAEWLLEKHDRGEIELSVSALNWGITPWHLNGEALNGLVGRIQSMCKGIPSDADVSVQLQLPNEWNPNLARANIGITAAVETDRCSPDWVAACNRMSAVVVPSRHIAATLNASGTVRVPLHVIPESYEPELAGDPSPGQESVLPGLPEFTFLVFGQITGNPATDRKNTFNAVKWLSDCFGSDPSVGIVLKTNSGRNTRIDRQLTLRSLRSALGASPMGGRIKVLHGEMSSRELLQLYTHPRVKALVSLTRGEGWGLPMLEAAVCGLPVIATDWSGHLDFMNRGKFLKVNYDLVTIPAAKVDGAIFVQSSRWAEPREDDFKMKVTKFRAADRVPRQWARDLADTVRTEFSPSRVRSLYDTHLGAFFR